ncbi:MAG TPA: hypothetical protein VHE13_07160 [Opitutus sp.]|nr:hypothetical protein [Opitutus sp.]
MSAKSELNAARTAFDKACRALGIIKNIVTFLRQIIAIPIWTLIVIAIAAVILGLFGLWFLALLLWVIILVYLVALVLVVVFTRVAVSLGQDLATQLKAITDAITKVLATCPEACLTDVDLTIPTCSAAT